MEPGAIETIAGVGYVEGVPARDAPAGWPMGIARNADGDLFVVDYWGHRIWRIDVDGVLHSYAGQGVPGNSGDGGPAAEALFDQPHDLRIDDDGNLYLSDLGNSTIRRIDAVTGIVTTIAGSGKVGRGGDGGPAVEAELDTHCGIAIDRDGNVFISSEWANNIRRIDARTGVIDRFAGWGRAPLPVRGRRQPPGVWTGPEHGRVPRRRGAGGPGRVPPPGAPGLRLAGRPVRVRQLEPPDTQDRHGVGHRHDGVRQRAGGVQRRRRASGRGERLHARRHLRGRPRQPVRGREVRVQDSSRGRQDGRGGDAGRHRLARLRRGGAARPGDPLQLLRGRAVGGPGRHRAVVGLLGQGQAVRRRDRHRHDRAWGHERTRRRGGHVSLSARAGRHIRRAGRPHILRGRVEPAHTGNRPRDGRDSHGRRERRAGARRRQRPRRRRRTWATHTTCPSTRAGGSS